MAEPKSKPQPRVAGRSKFRLPERQPRAAETNPLRELLQEAKAQADALTAPPAAATTPTTARHTPAEKIAGVGGRPAGPPPATVRRHTPAENIAGVAGISGENAAAARRRPTRVSFGDFSKRWAPILRSGQMSVCRVLFEMTHEIGEPECFISMPKLAAAAGLKERQCYNVIAQLEQLGFIERPEIFNTPEKKGTVFRLSLSPQEVPVVPNRRYHIGANTDD